MDRRRCTTSNSTSFHRQIEPNSFRFSSGCAYVFLECDFCSLSLSILSLYLSLVNYVIPGPWTCTERKCYQIFPQSRGWYGGRSLCIYLDPVSFDYRPVEPSLLLVESDEEFRFVKALANEQGLSWVSWLRYRLRIPHPAMVALF